jgi:hypothetical protein
MDARELLMGRSPNGAKHMDARELLMDRSPNAVKHGRGVRQ